MCFKVVLNDVEIEARKPKLKIYKKMMKLQGLAKGTKIQGDPEAYQIALEILVDAIGKPDVTVERLEDELDSDQFETVIVQAMSWITGKVIDIDLGEQIPSGLS